MFWLSIQIKKVKKIQDIIFNEIKLKPAFAKQSSRNATLTKPD